MSLWAGYLKECGLLEIIEEPWGFIMFHIEGGEVLFINDLYISPEARLKGNALSLFERACAWGRERGCTRVTTTVHTGSRVATESLKAILTVGFQIYSAINGIIVVTKPL